MSKPPDKDIHFYHCWLHNKKGLKTKKEAKKFIKFTQSKIRGKSVCRYYYDESCGYYHTTSQTWRVRRARISGDN